MSGFKLKEHLPKLKQADLMALFDVSDRTIQRWHDQGLPRHGEGRGCTYNWAQVLPWYVAHESGSKGGAEASGDRERKLRAEADLAEMEAAQVAGGLLEAQEVEAAWNAFLSRLKTNLDGYPDRAAQALEGLTLTLAERKDVLRRELAAVRADIVAEAQVEDAS